MEIKKFDEYTKEEQKELFNHWWHYYGGTYLFSELQTFDELIEEDIDFVKNVALLSFGNGSGPQDLAMVLRKGMLDEFRAGVAEIVAMEQFKEIAEEVEEEFIKEVVRTYNNPEPSIPLTSEQIIEGFETLLGGDIGGITVISVEPNGEVDTENEIVKSIVSQLMNSAPGATDLINSEEMVDLLHEIVGAEVGPFTVVDVSAGVIMKEHEEDLENDYVLSSKKVMEVYKHCILSDDEVCDHEPIVDFTMGEGVAYASVFNSERLAEKKEEIANMVDELADIEKGPSFLNLCMDKNGRQWTGNHFLMDCLVQLGFATEALCYTLDRDMWDVLPGGVPFIARSHEKDNEDIKKHAPKEYKKIAEKFTQNKTYTNEEDA